MVHDSFEKKCLDKGDHFNMIIIPKGTMHRPVCTELVKCLLIELDGTLTDANTGGTYGWYLCPNRPQLTPD